MQPHLKGVVFSLDKFNTKGLSSSLHGSLAASLQFPSSIVTGEMKHCMLPSEILRLYMQSSLASPRGKLWQMLGPFGGGPAAALCSALNPEQNCKLQTRFIFVCNRHIIYGDQWVTLCGKMAPKTSNA